MAVLQCILSLAEGFNFETTVEGVELAKHIEVFRDLKTTYGQGFLLCSSRRCETDTGIN